MVSYSENCVKNSVLFSITSSDFIEITDLNCLASEARHRQIYTAFYLLLLNQMCDYGSVVQHDCKSLWESVQCNFDFNSTFYRCCLGTSNL